MTKKTEERISIRLSNELKDKIARKLLDKGFGEKEKALLEKRYKFSEKVYNDFYPKKVREQMYALPDGWLKESSYSYFVFGNQNTGYCRREFKEPKRWLAKDMENSSAAKKVYEYQHPLTLEHSDLHEEAKTLNEEKNKAWAEINSIISQFTTSKALKQQWAEIAPIVEEFEPTERKAAQVMLPTLNNLNKILGV